MSDVSKVAHVVGAKTARACDGCIRKRARWFCAADDAFLCQSCVHSANPVSSRNERVRLKTASFRFQTDECENENGTPRATGSVPSWHSRMARTPRGKLQSSSEFKSTTTSNEDDVTRNLYYLVPEVLSDESTPFDEQLFYGRVPILLADSRSETKATSSFGANEVKGFVGNFYNEVGFVPSAMDLEEFAADVESLLGKGLDDDELSGMEGLRLMMDVDGTSTMPGDTTSMRCSNGRVMIKDEDVEKEEEEGEIEMANDQEVFDLSFDYNEEGEVDDKVEVVLDDNKEKNVLSNKKRKILLRLDYESILSAWDGSSPWAAGARPDVVPSDQCWPTCMATCEIESHQPHLADDAACLNGRIGVSGDHGGREARVSRYREKRRTRLFSKKIRYEVRKLNAEKRPRMKGRFVKRPLSSFPPTSSVFPCFLKQI